MSVLRFIVWYELIGAVVLVIGVLALIVKVGTMCNWKDEGEEFFDRHLYIKFGPFKHDLWNILILWPIAIPMDVAMLMKKADEWFTRKAED